MTCITENSRHIKFSGNQIVVISGKLHSPTIKGEIVNNGFAIFQNSYATMVACPGVVGWHFGKRNLIKIDVSKKFFHFVGISTNNQQVFVFYYLTGNIDKTFVYFVEHVRPIGSGMWPRKLNKLLFSPFGR